MTVFTCPWWVIAVLVSSFAGLGVCTAGANTLAVDLWVSESLQSIDNTIARFAGWIGDHLGGTTTGLTCLAIGFVAAALLRSARDAWFLGIVTVLRLLSTVLKPISDSPRPAADQVDLQKLYESTGFPSGHVTTATLLVGTLAFMVGRRIDRPLVRGGLAALCVLGGGLTAFARIWQGAHWFTDTVGGTIVGLVIVLMAANISAAITGWRSNGQRTAQSQMSG